MVNKLQISLIISILCILLGFISSIISESWLVDSGLLFLVKTPKYVPLISVSSFIVLFSAITFYIIYPTKAIFYVQIFISFVGLIFNIYFGFTWMIQPTKFFENMHDTWANSINTELISPVQFKMKCCGFYKVTEFTDDNCTDSKKNACFSSLNHAFNINVRSSGVFLLIFLIFQVVAQFLFFTTIKNDEIESRGVGKLYSRT